MSWRTLLLMGFALGCAKSSEKRGPEANTRTASSADTGAATAAAPPSALAPRVTLEAAAVKSLVETWLSAQNSGDFASYERTYAERFTGIKRSGSYSASFDRAGWLKDRAGMFTHPMQVQLKDLKVELAGPSARVHFEQTWATNNYRDVGAKELVVVATPAGARIAREEMLSSTVAAAEGQARRSDLWAMHPDGVILSTETEERWGQGAVRRGSTQSVALRDVNDAALPPALVAMKGRKLKVLDAAGAACETQITGFTLRAEIVPHFGMTRIWNGEEGEPALSAAKVADEVWRLAESSGRVLLGRFSTPCAGLWALPAEQSAPPAAKPQPADAALRERALQAFRALPAYQRIQKRFKAEENASGAWEDYQGGKSSVTAFRWPNKHTLVFVNASAGQGCNEFGANLSALFAVPPAASAAFRVLDTPEAGVALTAFALEGDDTFEVLLAPQGASDERTLWRNALKKPATHPLFSIPFLDCPC